MKRMGLMILTLGFLLFAGVAQADWAPAKRLTWTSGWSEYPAVAVDSSGNLHVVWDDDTPGTSEIYYKRSTDGGATWTTGKKLTATSGGCYFPDIAVDSLGTLHVVWYDYAPGNYEIFYRKSTDGGASWTATKRLTWTSGDSEYPTIAVDSSDHLHAAWMDDTPGNYEIYYKKSTDGGSTWAPSQRLSWTSGWSGQPALAADSSGTIHLVWDDETPGKSELYYRKSTDGGSTWTPSQRLTWSAGNSSVPAIAVDSCGYLHVAWMDDTPGKYEIYYKRSTDGGSTWTTSQRLTWNVGVSATPALAVDPSDNLHVVWHDNTPSNWEIYYKKSTDRGASWAMSQRLTWTSGDSYNPDIAVDPSGNIHLVWWSDAPDNCEIYYKKFIK